VDGAIKGLVYNSGAECCSGSRIFVQRSVIDAFTTALCNQLDNVVVGDPRDDRTVMGAIINAPQFEKIQRYIREGSAVATLARGGTIRDDLGGLFIEPTVFTDVPLNASIAREEIFGPVVALFPFDTVDDAIKLANDTEYGLAASGWTSNLETAMIMSRRVRSGVVWINTFLDVPSEMPIGGIRQRGYGRENGRFGIEEFTVIKTVIIQNVSKYSKYLP